jgi:hypothetical protein
LGDSKKWCQYQNTPYWWQAFSIRLIWWHCSCVSMIYNQLQKFWAFPRNKVRPIKTGLISISVNIKAS